MRPMYISPRSRKGIQGLVKFASQKDSWFIPSQHDWVPGDRPEYVVEIPFAYRCVFTITKEKDGKLLRMLTISIPRTNQRDRYPNPIVAFNIAHEFGFTGGKVRNDVVYEAGPDWLVAIKEEENCVLFAQPVKEEDLA